jgi:hypothetical protein
MEEGEMRRTTGIFGVIGMLSAGLVIAAPGAMAASYSVNACDSPVHNYLFLNGSTVVVEATGACMFALPVTEGSGNVWLQNGAPTWVSDVDGSGHGTVTFTIHTNIDSFAVMTTTGRGWNVPYIGACGANHAGWVDPMIYHCVIPAADDAGAAPSWFQSYQRPSSTGICTDGWNPSWALWPNHGNGGWVCDREQYWNTGAQGWAYR